jgi:hypothetical protein
MSLLIESLNSNIFGCIVVDSVTSFAPLAKFDGFCCDGELKQELTLIK